MEDYPKQDFIIVGSGPGAIMAAQTLLEGGRTVLILDGGNNDDQYNLLPGNNDFVSIRANDKNQFRFFLGDDFQSVPSSDVSTGAQLTPARKHIIKDVDRFCPVVSENFSPMESLAIGGLGAGWGLGAYVYNDAELEKAGLPVSDMRKAYQIIADRIGISCDNSDLQSQIAEGIKGLQPPLTPDNSIVSLLQKFKKKSSWFKNRNIYFGLPSMAILTEPKEDRRPNSYTDMDFYTDVDKSAWRPIITLEKLLLNPKFSYCPRRYVLEFKEIDNVIQISAIEMESKQIIKYNAHKLILAAGALGSARIALRSLPIDSLPLLCNPYTYMPAVHLNMLGKILNRKKTSMAQAMMIYNPDASEEKIISVAFYTYQSLLLMRLIQQSPFNIRDNRKIFKWLYPAFIIAGIHHPDSGHPSRKLNLEKDSNSETGDVLNINYEITTQMEGQIKSGEQMIQKALKRLGVFPIKKLNPGFGSSIHYGGTMPISDDEKIGFTSQNGKLHGTQNVYSADGAIFKFLPAKGITLSIMANAHRVALKIIEDE